MDDQRTDPAGRNGMRFRSLRIAVPAIGLAACVWVISLAIRDYRNYGWPAAVPYGFQVLPALLLTAAPWAKAPGQFCLRTLLIAITLLTVVLGVIVAFSR